MPDKEFRKSSLSHSGFLRRESEYNVVGVWRGFGIWNAVVVVRRIWSARERRMVVSCYFHRTKSVRSV